MHFWGKMWSFINVEPVYTHRSHWTLRLGSVFGIVTIRGSNTGKRFVSKTCRPVVMPVRSLVRWVAGFGPGGKATGTVKLTTDLYLGPKLKCSCTCTPTAFLSWTRDSFTCFHFWDNPMAAHGQGIIFFARV